jgi:hypothetical protein
MGTQEAQVGSNSDHTVMRSGCNIIHQDFHGHCMIITSHIFRHFCWPNNLLTPSDLVFQALKCRTTITFHGDVSWDFPYIYISEVTLGKVVRFPSNLVGGIPTPLKNDGVRQLGRWHSQLNGKSSKIHVPKHQPDLSLHYCYGYPKTNIHLFSKIDLVIMLDPNGGAPCCFVNRTSAIPMKSPLAVPSAVLPPRRRRPI